VEVSGPKKKKRGPRADITLYQCVLQGYAELWTITECHKQKAATVYSSFWIKTTRLCCVHTMSYP